MVELMATRDAYGKALVELGRKNPKLVVLDSDTSASTRTALFAKEFPDRFFNLGIAEANMISVAAGLATCGLVPFASSFAAFGTARVYEQIRICVCWTNLNVKIVVTHAGISVGEDGVSHQMMEDISLMRVLPNMRVIVPCDGVEAEKAILASADSFGPTYIRLGRAKFPILLPPNYEFKIGKASVLADGEDVTIIATGIMVGEALKAHEILIEKGISARVLNVSTIKPIDEELIIKAAQETGAIVTAEEHSIIGGLGSAVSEVLSERTPVPLRRIGIKDKFGISGAPRELLEKFEMTDTHIVQAVHEVIEHKKKHKKSFIYDSSTTRI